MGKMDKEMIRIAAEAGAKAAIEKWEKEIMKVLKKWHLTVSLYVFL